MHEVETVTASDRLDITEAFNGTIVKPRESSFDFLNARDLDTLSGELQGFAETVTPGQRVVLALGKDKFVSNHIRPALVTFSEALQRHGAELILADLPQSLVDDIRLHSKHTLGLPTRYYPNFSAEAALTAAAEKAAVCSR